MQFKNLLLMTVIGCSASRRPVPKTVKLQPAVRSSPSSAAKAPTEFGSWQTGQGNWSDNTVISQPQIQWAHKLRGPVIHPITTDGKRIYVTASGSVYCFSADGEALWDLSINADGSPIPFQGDVYVPTGLGVVQRINVETGTLSASFGGEHPIRVNPFTLDGNLVWIDQAGQIFRPSGKTSVQLPGPIVSAVSDHQNAYIATVAGQIYRLSVDGILWTTPLDGPISGHPLVFGNHVFAAFSGNTHDAGGMVALDKNTGDTIWVTQLPYDPIRGPAVGEHLVIASLRPELIAIDLEHGGIRWRAPGQAQSGIQPTVVDDAIYTGDGAGRLRRIDMNDGGTVWKMELGAPITGEGVVVNDRLITGTADGRIVAVGDP